MDVPGLFDAHVHFFQSGGLYTRPDIVDLTSRVPYADERAAVRASLDRTLARYLPSGVTSVVDMGGSPWNLDVRAHAGRTALAPRVQVAGPLLASVSRPQLPRRSAHPRGRRPGARPDHRARAGGAAAACGRAGELGSVEAGKLADLVVLDASPLADVRNLARIRAVVKDGVPHTPEEILAPTPGERARRQESAARLRE